MVCWLRLAQPEPQPSRWRPAASWRLCRLETARALWVLCRLGWGVTLVGKTAFSFVGKRDVFTLRWFLPAQLGPQPSRWRLRRLTDGAYPLRVKPLFLLQESGLCLPYSWFLPTRLGPKPLFLLLTKEKAVLDSEKEKVDQWKSWGGTVQQDRLPMLRCCSSGEIPWDIVLLVGGLRLSDPWSLLRHCR